MICVSTEVNIYLLQEFCWYHINQQVFLISMKNKMITVVHRAIKGSFYFQLYFTIAADWRFSGIKHEKKKRTKTFP